MTTSGDGFEPAPDAPVLELRNVTKHFPVERGALIRRRHGVVHAADGVSLSIPRGTTLGLVGESGSGKSTTARLACRVIAPTSGEVRFCGSDITPLSGGALRRVRRGIQMVFQDPYSSFDPLAPIGASVAEPLLTHARLTSRQRRERISELLELVGLSSHHLGRYPAELSGGQLQRAAVARALTVDPELVVLDEPVSALDVSTQAQVINLLRELQDRLHVAYFFIAHDLSVVRHVSETIAVMYLGHIVEKGPAAAVYDSPTHPYTAALLSAIPVPNPRRQRARKRIVIGGDVPSPIEPPTGCRFHTRCPFVMDVCRSVEPPEFLTPAGVTVRCHLHTEGPRLGGASVKSLSLEASADSTSPSDDGSAVQRS